MADERDPVSGTPDDLTDDVASQEGGTPEESQDDADAGDAKATGVDPALAMSWKAKAERVNELEREIAEMRQRQSYQPPPTMDPQVAAQQQQLAEVQNEIRHLEYLAQTDVNARATLRLMRRQEMMELRILTDMQIMRAPKERQDAIRKELSTGRYADADAALDALDGRELRAERSRIDAEKRELAEVRAKRDRGVVATGRSPVTRSEDGTAKVWTPEKFDNEVERLEASGDIPAARALRARLNKGDIQFRR